MIKSMDIIALPTYYPSEAFPISILEAMSYGKMVMEIFLSCIGADIRTQQLLYHILLIILTSNIHSICLEDGNILTRWLFFRTRHQQASHSCRLSSLQKQVQKYVKSDSGTLSTL